MNRVKHFSLDVWNTLLTPNPLFAKARTEYLSDITHVSLTRCEAEYTSLKRELDSAAKNMGAAMSSIEAFDMLMYRICGHWHNYPNLIMSDVNQLFLSQPPTICYRTLETMHLLQQERGLVFSILSNTNFISGHIIRPLLTQLFADVDFQYMLFSDIEGYSKPSVEFFNKMLKLSRCAPIDIMHVGDDWVCDGDGASLAGIRNRIISNPDELHTVLVNN